MNNQYPSSLPVFVQPTELQFIVSNPETHKRVLTVYNPYDFSLRYTVLSNAPTKFRVVEPRGFIRSKCYLDIIVRHLSATLAAVDANDCLRIEIFKEGESGPCGRKDIPLNVLLNGNSRNINEEQFRAFPDGGNSGRLGTSLLRNRNSTTSSLSNSAQPKSVSFVPGPNSYQNSINNNNNNNPVNSSIFNGFLIFCFFVCVVLLILPVAPQTPITGDSCVSPDLAIEQSLIPSFSLARFIPLYLRPSSTIQLVASYTLGLLTAVFFLKAN